MVVDTSILIEHLRAKDKLATTLYKISANSDLFVSAVTIYELYMGAISEDKRQDIKMLTEGLSVLHFTDDVAIKASQIYHQLKANNQIIEFRDIFIAATCIVNGLPISTLNKKHFSRIADLIIIE